jgi:chromosomal replication initiator protein
VEKLFKRIRLKPSFSFDNFAVSSSNEMAYAASKAVVREPGKAYNPLFFYGGVGVGKTHLMQAIAQEAIKKNQQIKILYCTGEEFTNEIIEAIQGKKTSLFRRKFRLVPLLLIDDIQFIAGKNTVQEEFFHTFNAILQEGGQIILTSDRPPSEIQKLEERLASRFEAGLLVDIQEPNFELRTAILLIKSKTLNLKIPMDVAQMVAAKITSTRQLEGALIRIKAYMQAQEDPITPDTIANMLQFDIQKSSISKKLNPREVISQVAHYFNLKASQIKGKERHQFIVLPRQIAMYLLRTDSNYSLVEIGRFFGNRDHTTVIHAVDKINKLLAVSEEVRFNVSSLRKNLS